MINTNEFVDVLRNPMPDNTQPAVNILREVSEAIEIATDHTVRSWLEKGFPNVEYGQEYRVIISSSARSYEETLLRAYVPLSGKPICVFPGGNNMQECADEVELKATLKEFLQAEPVRTLIQQLSNLSA